MQNSESLYINIYTYIIIYVIYCNYQHESLQRNKKQQHPSHKIPPSSLNNMQAPFTRCIKIHPKNQPFKSTKMCVLLKHPPIFSHVVFFLRGGGGSSKYRTLTIYKTMGFVPPFFPGEDTTNCNAPHRSRWKIWTPNGIIMDASS